MNMLLLVKSTFQEFIADKCPRMAAALAYYTAFSLTPLLILISSICSFIWDPSVIEGSLERQIEGVVGADGAKQVKTMLSGATNSDKSVVASVLSAVFLLIGATGVVGQLQGALNDAWEVKPDPEQGGVMKFLLKRILSFGMICGIAFLLLVSLALSSVLSAAGDVIAGSLPLLVSETLLIVLNSLLSFGVISLLFAVMFKYLPDAKIQWSDVKVGALLTGALFVLGKFAIGAYLGSKNMESSYGASGSLALIMVWIYYSAMILLFGAEFTQVWAKQHGSGVQPAEGAIKL